MKKLVEDFPNHVEEAIQIAESVKMENPSIEIANVIVSGLGGSGIGGTIVSQLLADELSVPVIINKDYSIPSFANENTLFIACSYSGNTEETLIALEKAEAKGTEICAITSGGKLDEIADLNGYNKVNIPGGFPPRSAFGYSSVQLFYILNFYGLVNDNFKSSLKKVVGLLKNENQAIRKEAEDLAKNLNGTIPIIYSDAGFEGIGVRFRQQINENAKMLCWHHVIPEMNHNELVGWAPNYQNTSVVIFRNEDDYYRTQERMNYSSKLIEGKTTSVTEVWSKGDSKIEKAYYLIHLGDFASVHLAELKNIDAVEVDVITGLKNRLAEI